MFAILLMRLTCDDAAHCFDKMFASGSYYFVLFFLIYGCATIVAKCDHYVFAAIYFPTHSPAQTIRPIYTILSAFNEECCNLDFWKIEIFIPHFHGCTNSKAP
jgi:hypothetical protein